MQLRTTLLAAILLVGSARSSLVRLRGGDSFSPEPLDDGSCGGCVEGSARSGAHCDCACLPETPVYRDDIGVCVDDIQECQLAPFVGATGSQRVPFVFLPLRGQIVNPSAAVAFPDASAPVCVVSGAQLLTSGGWTDIRNVSAFAEPPFRLFRDEGRTFLQWLGETELRASLEGRLVLVRMLCKEVTRPRVFAPCAAFRVAGSPGVREVAFDLLDGHSEGGGLSGSEVAAVGVCAVLLGLVYAASVLLYVHVRRRRKPTSSDASLEGGVVKRNPLLQPPRRARPALSEADSCTSEDDVSEQSSDLPDSDEDTPQTTAALVHMRSVSELRGADAFEFGAAHELVCHAHAQEPERRPEQNVSIVETVGADADERGVPADCGALSSGAFRRKLYFNPAYFEPALLAMPPPAALDFLSKIREVISLAKHKMSAKRFSPTLVVIPEETATPVAPRGGSVVSLKRDNSRHVSWCEPPLPLAPCCGGESKHLSIRRWLADVPDDGPPRKRQAPARPVAPTGTVVKKKLMDAVIKELTRAPPPRYDADSLERGGRGCLADDDAGFHTPSDYADVPLGEELVARNAVYARDGCHDDGGGDDDGYEPVDVRAGYSLVSEVYVNDAFGSDVGSSPRPPRIRYAHPGHLTIELPPVALPAADVEEFEPDTLDRPEKKSSFVAPQRTRESYVDSLERHAHILLRTDGSFRSPASLPGTSPLGREFGSLRDIYEARAGSTAGSTRSLLSDLGTSSRRRNNRLARRQRVPPSTFRLPPATFRPSASNTFAKPPPAQPPRPPKPTAHVIYEVPRPLHSTPPVRPPLPPKAARNPAQRPLPALPRPPSSADSLNSSDEGTPLPRDRAARHRPEDSGYLSSDSAPTESPSDETDAESVFDGASESGAESVATDSFFFGQRASVGAREPVTVA